jgi:hypothetical protein
MVNFENPKINDPDSSRLLWKKAAILAAKDQEKGGKGAIQEQHLEEAAKHLERMKKTFGSSEALEHILDFELELKSLASEQAACVEKLVDLLRKNVEKNLIPTLVQEARRREIDPTFQFIDFILENLDQMIDRELFSILRTTPGFGGLLSIDEIQLSRILTSWKQFILKSIDVFFLKEQKSSSQKDRKNIGRRLALSFPGQQPPPPPSQKTVLSSKKTQTQVSLSAASEGEPPQGPEDYALVEPENLEDVIFPNGDQLLFRPAMTIKDDRGRERNFFHGFYSYTPKGSQEKKTIDLSRYVAGKIVIFEGTKGGITGGSLDPNKVRGWATPLQKRGLSAIALNLESLKRDGPKRMLTVFHELGHVYLFGKEEKMLQREKSFLGKIFGSLVGEKPELTGLQHYQREARSSASEALKDILHSLQVRMSHQEQLLRSLNGKIGINPVREQREKLSKIKATELENMQQLIDKLKYYRSLNDVFSPLGSQDSSSFQKLFQEIPDLKILWSVFHERYARAYALRQIRKLNPDLMIKKSAMVKDQSLKDGAAAAYGGDARFVKGPLRGSRRKF